MNTSHRIAISIAALCATIAAQSSDTQSPRKKNGSQNALIIASDGIIGAAVDRDAANGNDADDKVRDFAIRLDTGAVESVILESGAVLPMCDLQWNASSNMFTARTQSRKKESASQRDIDTVDASSSTSSDGQGRSACILASSLSGCEILGRAQRSEDGAIQHPELGSVGGMFVDVHSGNVAFLTTSIGGVLGIGADSKVIPWSAMEAKWDAKDNEYDVCTRLTDKRLEMAPNYGEGAKKLHNPEYRGQLYSYFGTDRPTYDRNVDSADAVHVATLNSILGTQLEGMESDRSISNLMIDQSNGSTPFVVLDNGHVVPTSRLRWNPESSRFAMGGPSQERDSVDSKANFIMADALSDVSITAIDGAVGSLENLYFDTSANTLKFVTVATGTTLGMGGEVRVLPWTAVTIEKRDGTTRIRVPMSKSVLESAPKLDGSTGSDVHNPEFCERVRRFGEITDKN